MVVESDGTFTFRLGRQSLHATAALEKQPRVTVPVFLEDIPRVREEAAQYYSTVSRFDVAFGLIWLLSLCSS